MANRQHQAVDKWMEQLQGQSRELFCTVRGLLMEASDELAEDFKWGAPCYTAHGNVCYVSSTGGTIRLGFFQGNRLSDPQGLLMGQGTQHRHLKLKPQSEVPHATILSMLEQAMVLDQSRK